MKYFFIFCAVLFLSSCGAMSDRSEETHIRPKELLSFDDYPTARKFTGFKISAPPYPRRAQHYGEEAAVAIIFNIDTGGNPFDLRVLY